MGCVKTGGFSNQGLLTVGILSHDLASWLFSFCSSVLLSQDSLLPQEIIIKVEREDAGSLALPSQVSWPLCIRKCTWLVGGRDQVEVSWEVSRKRGDGGTGGQLLQKLN